MVRIAALSAAGLVALALAGPSANAGGDPVAQAAAVTKVSMGDNFFAPVKAKVAPGGKVKWTNNGKVDHNVTFPNGFASGNLKPGESTVRKFTRAGKFPYSCTIHPGMDGKVRVVAG
jgi:plastocyanin